MIANRARGERPRPGCRHRGWARVPDSTKAGIVAMGESFGRVNGSPQTEFHSSSVDPTTQFHQGYSGDSKYSDFPSSGNGVPSSSNPRRINPEHEEKIRGTFPSESDSNLIGPAEANGLRINQSDFRCVLNPHPERLIEREFLNPQRSE
jgi:hypothetical protein